jgi:hypothetical protein
MEEVAAMAQSVVATWSPVLSEYLREKLKNTDLTKDWVVILINQAKFIKEYRAYTFDGSLEAEELMLHVCNGGREGWAVHGLYHNGFPCQWGRTHIISTMQVYPAKGDK